MSQSKSYIRTSSDVEQILVHYGQLDLDREMDWYALRALVKARLRGTPTLLNRVTGLLYRKLLRKKKNDYEYYRNKSLQKINRLIR